MTTTANIEVADETTLKITAAITHAAQSQTAVLFRDLARYKKCVRELERIQIELAQRKFRPTGLRRLSIDVLNTIIADCPIPTLSLAMQANQLLLFETAMQIDLGHINIADVKFVPELHEEAMAYINAIIKRHRLALYADAEIGALHHSLCAQIDNNRPHGSIAQICETMSRNKPPKVNTPLSLTQFRHLLTTNKLVEESNGPTEQTK